MGGFCITVFWQQFSLKFSLLLHSVLFCMRPSAKDLGITRVVIVLVLFRLAHFLFKRNLSEKKFSISGYQSEVLLLTSQLSYSDIVKIPLENYLFKFQKPHRRPGASPGSRFVQFH